MGMFASVGVLDMNLVTDEVKAGADTYQVLMLHAFSLALGIGAVAMFLLFYSFCVATKFVNDSLDDYKEAADTHIRGEAKDHPGLGTASHIFVAEAKAAGADG